MLVAHLRFWIVVLPMLATGVLIELRPPVPPPPREPLALLPNQLGSWTGSDVPLDEDTLKILGHGEFLQRDYENTSNPQPGINLFVAYYPSQRAGDTLHPPENVEKMRRGVPLTDADRWPWLDRIGALLKTWADEGRSGLVTCSALKRAYRERLLAARPDLCFIYLKGSEALIASRVAARHHEYMPASLLRSQFDALEEPEPGEPVITIDADATPDAEAEAIVKALGR